MKIVIASAGRRAHYLEWFRHALSSQGVRGEVIAMEYRSLSPSVGIADRVAAMPAYNSPEYPDALLEWCTRERPELFVSLNDYELQILSGELAGRIRELGCRVAVLDPRVQPIVLDKHRMAATLAEHGIPTPPTVLGSEIASLRSSSGPEDRFVIKHRFGSGSTGLQLASPADLAAAVEESARTALGADGLPATGDLSAVVVQEALPGSEYGVDGVFDVDGRSDLLGVLARRKDVMRGGDTDVATTVDPERFRGVIGAIGELLRPSGAIDVDLRETAAGEPLVIDINPRLGGGYPFCHRAGADLPGALVRSAAGLAADPSLLRYQAGVTTARREEFTVVSAPR
ncbi:hypothetical protein DEO23_10090 [Brachybacterium endophyticum]|uniref:ATP-grasp domain-containing protein n=1 Tax=Brachybacterium endophyticum TaxID=2182385 RepID=A0A2U2RJX6_9MICO|nr:ATP-grasp domain-containing protein [Brachybacterium endophyticum]PWH06146.1 hypothetical protein DEO23_10090 [Brachybacterium endophyticum]